MKDALMRAVAHVVMFVASIILFPKVLCMVKNRDKYERELYLCQDCEIGTDTPHICEKHMELLTS